METGSRNRSGTKGRERGTGKRDGKEGTADGETNNAKEMTRTFRYGRMDRRARRITALCIAALVLLLAAVWYFWSDGGYIMAVAASLFGAVLLLYIMSIPRKVTVGDVSLEIRCLVEITRIKYSDLRSIRRIEPQAMKKKIVLLGSYGFFGYYGYYIDLHTWDTAALYCKQWDNFIEIIDAYEKRYIISTPAPDELISAATEAMRLYSDSKGME